MASAVAWADWVMSCCGVGSVAMLQILDSQIMVRSGKWGRTQKWLYLGNCQSDLPDFWTAPSALPEGVCYAVEHWQWCQGHDDITMGADGNVASQKWENTVIFILILYKYGLKMQSKWMNDMERYSLL